MTLTLLNYAFHARIKESFGRGCPTWTVVFFLVDEGKDAQNTYTTIIGPSLARQQNAILMAFHWRSDDGPILNAGLVSL